MSGEGLRVISQEPPQVCTSLCRVSDSPASEDLHRRAALENHEELLGPHLLLPEASIPESIHVMWVSGNVMTATFNPTPELTSWGHFSVARVWLTAG